MPHTPAALQTWTAAPEHWIEPGAQAPVQVPETHAVPMQRTGSPHEPVLPQVCTPLPEHWVAPGRFPVAADEDELEVAAAS